jgi:glycosyltransferase involved in cell wall biosynthesis
VKILILGSKEYPFHSGIGYEVKPSGGIEFHVEKLVKYLSLERQNVFLITRKFPKQKKFETLGNVKIYRAPFIKNIFLRALSFNFISFIMALKIIKRNKIDIIHAHGPIAGFFSYFLSKMMKVPYVYTPHGLSDFWTFPIREILGVFNKIAIKGSKKVLFISELVYKKMNHDPKYKLLTNAIDFEDYKSTKRTWKSVRFLFLGRLEEVKGIKELLDAFKKLQRNFSNTELYIAGGGTMKNYILNFIEKNKIKNIKFLGWIKNSPDILSKTDVFVLPSEEKGQPVALLEAMASGKIIITSLDYIEDGRTGIKVKARDIEDIYKKMVYVCKNFEKCTKYGENARIIAKELDWKKIIRSFLKEYKLALTPS